MLSNNLISVDQMFNINFTYHNDVYSCCSSPDHILTLSNYAYLIDSVSVLDSVEIFSDHLSLHLTLKFSNFLSLPSNLCPSVNNCCTSGHPHSPANSSVNWFKVTPCDVSSYCDQLLSTIPEFPTDIRNCCDPDCTSHHSDLNTYCVQLFNCIAAAADLCLPKHRQCQRRSPLSGWNVAAQYLKQSAHFWHKVCGCPTSGILIQIKKNSKRRFKYEVRRLRRRQSHIRHEKLAYTPANKSFGSLLK